MWNKVAKPATNSVSAHARALKNAHKTLLQKSHKWSKTPQGPNKLLKIHKFSCKCDTHDAGIWLDDL